MKKSISKLMALVLIVALISSVAAFSASAATTYTAIGGSTTITKNLVVKSTANIPDIEFTYTITRAERIAPTSTTVEILQSPVGATIGTAAFSNADTEGATPGLPTDTASPTSGYKYASKNITVTFPAGSFTKPGVYRYVIVEGNGSEPGVTYDANNTRYLDVFVTANNTNELAASSYVLRSSATPIGLDLEYTSEPTTAKSNGYTNTVTQHDFTFTKTISGNQGDKNKRFTFTLDIKNAIPGTYPLLINDVTGNPTTITVGTDGSYSGTFDLSNGSSITVHGLNDNSVCTVSEDAQDYTPSHAIDGGSDVVGTNTSGTITMDNNHSVAFTNTRNGTVPTGVLLTVAPFAIGLMLFGAIGITMMARRKEEE